MVTISVIIPAWRPRDFAGLRESIRVNSDVDVEWIVVDDGSGPEFRSLFSSLPPQVRLITKANNSGQGAARNSGLLASEGTWIKFLDADDQLDSGHLAALLACTCERGSSAIPFAPTKHIFPSGAVSVNNSWSSIPPESQSQFCRQLVRPFVHHCGALFSRELLMKLGGYDETLATDEDGDLLLRILHLGYHFVPVEGIYYLYTHHNLEGRVSADDGATKFRARARVCEKVVDSFGTGVPQAIAMPLAQRMDRIAMTYWAMYPVEAKALLSRARRLAPGYQPDVRMPLRLLRAMVGFRVSLSLLAFYRYVKGRPRGGMQG
jgi:glycosyltransferase involved in cell wall biosynthesis